MNADTRIRLSGITSRPGHSFANTGRRLHQRQPTAIKTKTDCERFGATVLLWLCTLLGLTAAQPLTTLEYHIIGAQLRVTPIALSVPKNVAGSVLVELTGGTSAAPTDAFVEATLRGPSFPARRVLGQVNQALLLPPLPLVGDYQLDNIRLVHLEGTNSITLQEANPSSVAVRVFDEVLVSRVTSRPLTLDEIRERGIAIDDKNFRAIEFEVGFILDGKTVPVRFPVVAPAFQGNTEIIPAAELQKRLAEAAAINSQIDLGSVLPPELETARLNIDIKGINFQVTEESGQDLALSIPPIPALMVVPGNIGFLNQFFSVQIFTENAAPAASGLSVVNVKAQLKLPAGPDLIASTNYDAPGDDPLRFARVGPDKITQPIQPVVRPGADGKTGTPDDIPRLFPGESGTGEFLVEGLQEGLHIMDLDLTADLEGLAAGIVKIKGTAAGSVLVRNPRFSMAFSHPRTVRAGEPYDLYVSILNTSSSAANLVQVALAAASVSGGTLESPDLVVLGTILPGQTATAKFRVRATQTGAISFSNLSTSDDSLVGRFRLRGGIDERGVALSPDTIGMPSYVTNLPPALVDAANRLLGQALSVATAGQLPAGVKPIGKSVVTRRVLELAEAGQRVLYGDSLERVLPDLLLDWQGGRVSNPGFDQILRETEAGREWREAMGRHLDQADGRDAVGRLIDRLPDLAGRGEPWDIIALDVESGPARLGPRPAQLSAFNSIQLLGLGKTNFATARYDDTNSESGLWFVAPSDTNTIFEWRPVAPVPTARLAFARIDPDGTARRFEWRITDLPARGCVLYDPSDPAGRLQIDRNCDGTNDATLTATIFNVQERPPALISVRQDPDVLAGRPTQICTTVAAYPLNYGTVLAVLFSKPMAQEQVNVPAAYSLENGNVAGSVQIQPGGRVALLNMREPVGALRARTMTIRGVTDPHANTLAANTATVFSNLRGGAAVHGRVARGDGSPAAGLPVTLTYYDEISSAFSCEPWIVRPAQVFTDENGYFDFDFVVSGIPYSVSATDTAGLSADAIALILESTRGDELQRAKLLELANSASARNTLLGDFATGTLTDAVAKAEGLDRALLRDLIPSGSGREGTEVAVALRFRGRGAVAGQVVAANGVTPMAHVAVNLFPDPASRELGRGLFTDTDGRFAFFGVPLGIFSIEANSGTGLGRTLAGVIDQPGQTTNVLVVLSTAQVARTDLTGRVTENDNATPHAGATVFIGKFDGQGRFCCVVAAPTADSDGFWRAAGIPADTYVLKAVSLDGRRQGERRDIAAPTGVTNFAAIALQGFGVVIGRVETATGIPVVNAIVAGGDQLVRTTNNGTFRLTGVPTGLRTIGAGAERSRPNEPPKSSPAFSFPRLGSATLNVLPGVDNFVVIRFEPRGSLIGRVVDETGTNAVTGLNVALPELGGFQWAPVNSRGEFAFEGIALKHYVVSAPAPSVFNTDVSGILDTLGSGSAAEGELQAAIGEAFAIFTGAADPLLNGQGGSFNPNRWGYIDTDLTADGEIKNVTVQFFRSSTIAGRVLNGQGAPMGARVRLTGIGPGLNGAPITVIRGERNSDPALGTFSFERQAFIGSYGLQAASSFFPVVLVTNGFTSEILPDDTNIVLRFPAAREVNGRLAGIVLTPAGLPVGSNVNVKISFGTNFIIRTRADGTFDTQIGLPALQLDGSPGKGYFIEADDPVTGGRGAASVTVMPGNTNVAENSVTVRLLGRGALRITVLRNDGAPVAGARVAYDQGSYPYNRVAIVDGPITDASGQALFPNLFEGSYGACARFISGPTTLYGRGGVSLERGKTNDVVIRLGPTGNIEGFFVKRDGVTPVGFAQIAIGTLGFATTDSNGFFRVGGIPIGTHRLTGADPISGIGASLSTVLSFNDQTNFVRLIEQSRGEIRGGVIASDGTNFAPGVTVTLNVNDGLTPARTVTSGPDGRFSFPGAPAGPFNLVAIHPVTGLTGGNSGVLPENAALVEINVPLQPLAALTVRVLRPDGITPGTNATVTLEGDGLLTADTDLSGRVAFADLKLRTYVATASSRVLNETRSIVRTNVTLTAPGRAPELVLRLAGVGQVEGRVFLSDGSTPAVGAEVTLSHLGEIARYSTIVTTDGTGLFVVSNVAVGPYEIRARAGSLGARIAGGIGFDGETDVVTLTVEPSGAIRGRLVRSNGVTPVAGEDVSLTLPGRGLPASLFRTGTNGAFEFISVPLGFFRLQSTALRFNGIALREGTLAINGQTNDVGNVVMDEDDPRVVRATPSDTAIGVPITTVIQLEFNEALRSNTVDTTGIYLQGPSNTVTASVQLLGDTNGVPRVVRLIPAAPLRSLTTYRIVVVDSVRLDAFGGVIGRGPQDLVGRPLVAPFLGTFTTADNDPPQLVSIFPTNGQVQIDPRSVMRLSFSEPIRETDFSFTLIGTNGLVPGAASVGLNGLVLAFAPTAALSPNTSYTLSVSNVFDLAGNRAANEPFTATFTTVDTLGPDIISLSIVGARSPVVGSTVEVEAQLAGSEPGASVRFTQDLRPIGAVTNAPFRLSVPLTASGTNTVRAIATDRFGNDGPLAELVITTLPNQPPTVTLTRLDPASGPVFRGEPFSIRIDSSDDVAVTNLSVTIVGTLNVSTNVSIGAPATLVFTVPTNTAPGSILALRAQATDFAGLIATAAVDLVVNNLNHRPVAGLVQTGAGGALQLDGNDDLVSGILLRDMTNDFTMELWVNPTASHRLTSEAIAGGEGVGGMRYAVYPQHGDGFGGGNHAGAGISVGTNGIAVAEHAASYLPTTLVYREPIAGWTHVAVTYEARRPSLYLNGALVRRGLTSTRDVHPSANISGFPPYGDYQGQVDEFRIWRAARTEREIRETMNQRLTGRESGLVGYWRFDETNGSAAFDAVSDTNTLTLAEPPAQPARVASTAPVGAGAIVTNTSAAILPITLAGFDPDGDPLTAQINSLPAHAALFQTTDGLTTGAAITNVPALITHPNRVVLVRRQVGYTGPDEFRYALSDGIINSFDAFVLLDLVTPSNLDTDGDGLPDRYEFVNGLNPEVNDASLDADSDGLNNLAEFQAGTNPRNPDTDGDGFLDGSDPNPLQPSTGAGLVITTYANVIDPVQLSFAPDGTLFAGRDNSGSTNSPGASADAVKIHRVGAGGEPVTEYGDVAIPDPDGVAFDPAGAISGTAGSVLVAGSDGSGGFIRAIKPDQTVIPVFGPSGSFGNPQTAKLDRNGRLLFIEPSVVKGVWASTGSAPSFLFALPGNQAPVHFAVAADNSIFISDGAGVLRHYAPNGTLLNASLVTGLTNFYFDISVGGAFGTNIWGVDALGRLLEVNPASGAVAQHASGLGSQCSDAVFGPDGMLYLAQFDQDRILRVAPVVCAPIPSGLTHWYSGDFDGRDLAGTDFGTLEGAVTAGNSGKVGGAFRFNGVSGGVNLGNVPDLDFAPDASFSLEAWFNSFGPTGSSDGQMILVLNYACGNTFQGLAMQNLPDNYGRVVFQVRDANGVMTNIISPTVSSNQFHHVVGVREVSGPNRTLHLYVDGALIGSRPDPTTGPLALNTPDLIGRRFPCNDESTFNGLIDEVAIYRRALTVAEVQAQFTAGSLGKCPATPAVLPAGALAWWNANNSFTDQVGGVIGVPAGGAGFSDGIVGTAFHLDGVDDEINLGNEVGNFGTNDFTVEFWVQSLQSSPARVEVVLSKRPICNFSSFWNLFISPNGLVSAEWCGGPAPTFGVSATRPVNDGQFHHIAFRREGTNASIWMDGVLDGSVGAPAVSLSSSAPFLIGANPCVGANTFRFTGRLDELTLYSRALTAAEIGAIASAGRLGKVPPSCVPLPVNAVTWWRGENNVQDSVATNVGVLLGGATFAAGKVGQAFGFDGVNSQATIPDGPSLRFTNDFTMELWFLSANSPNFAGLLDKFEQVFPDTTGFQISFNDRRGLRADFGFGSSYATVENPQPVMDGQWHHAAVTWDRTQLLLYVDGVPGEPALATNLLLNNTEPLVLGVDNCCPNRNFKGLLDEIAIYNRALAASEIAAIVAAGNLGKCLPTCVPVPAGVVGWWRGENDAEDTVGTRHGAFANASFVPGIAGQAFQFTGSQFVEIPDDPALDFVNALTIEFWVSPTVPGLANGTIFFLGKGNMNNVGTQSYGVLFGEDRRVLLRLGNASAIDQVPSAHPLPLDSFSHVALTYDGTEMRVYINGILENTRATSIGALLNTTGGLILGGADFNSTKILTSVVMDEVSLYNRALSAFEIATIVSAANRGKCPPVCAPLPADAVAWWQANGSPNDILGGTLGLPQNGASFSADGRVNSAFRLDGIDDFVDIGPLAALDNAAELTLMAWVKRQNTDDTVGGILGKWNTGGAPANSFLLYNGEDGAMNRGQFCIAFDNGSAACLGGTTVMDRDAWYHLAVSWRNSDGQLLFYKNGALEAVSSAGAGRFLQTHRSYTAKIGEWGVLRDSRYKWPGLIDEVMAFRRALDSTEVAAIAAASNRGVCSVRIGDLLVNDAASQLTLQWSAAPHAQFTIEMSANLVQWEPAPAVITESPPGAYRATFPIRPTGSNFFRLKTAAE